MLEFYPEIEKELEKIADKARDDLGDNLTGKVGKNRREPGLTITVQVKREK